jgi:hypothetical protein
MAENNVMAKEAASRHATADRSFKMFLMPIITVDLSLPSSLLSLGKPK